MNGIETIVEDRRWTSDVLDPESLAERCYRAAAKAEPRVAGLAALLLADDIAVAELNRRFRFKDGPTNVLSFVGAEPGSLGDIAIAYDTCVREAAEKSIALADYLSHLIVHGLLHLAGHDHEEDGQAEEMEALETRILDALGISNPFHDVEGAG